MEKDKILHFGASALIVILASVLFPLWVAVVLSIMCGIAKELLDDLIGGVPSWKDFAFDLLGILAGFLIRIAIWH